ncbi:MAG: LLM class flavin-dependent oxidoreductase [Actinobacteria bacterium]|nr:LLM class flavin-dependent oxidoreductase [Actinomycetota bacterium]
MKFALLYEFDMPPWLGSTEHDIFWEAVEQVKLAEEVGFEYTWAVEHHFLKDFSHTSAPEIFLSALAQHTTTMRIGHGVVLLPIPFNHPVRVAERIAMLDIASNGRVEFGTGRSITTEELGGFGIHPDDSRPMWDEAVRIIPKMMTQDLFEGFEGKYVTIPPRHVVPKPIQKPHPPMWMACTSPTSFEIAGRYGLGVLCFTIGEPEWLAENIKTYREAIKHAEPVGAFVNEQVAGFTALHCGPDDAEARRVGGEAAIWYFGKLFEYFGELAAYDGYREYKKLADEAKVFYEEEMKDKLIDTMAERAVICAGDPDRCIEVVKEYEAQGIDQFIGIVQYGGIRHQEILDGIRLFGDQVIPAFR